MENGHMDTAPWSRVSTRAQDLSRQAQRFVHDRPLQAIAFTIAVGFVVGKILSGRNE